MNLGNIILILFFFIILLLVIIYVIIFLFKTDKSKSVKERLYETFHHYKKYILFINYEIGKSDVDSKKIDGSFKLDENDKEILKGDFQIIDPVPTPPPPIIAENEVYNVGRNIFTYDDAHTVCKSLGGRLANKNEIDEAYKKGGNWCNNGWSADMHALYPIQGDYYKHEMNIGNTQCGKPGVNGGYMPFPDLKLSANCYGIKPKPDPNRIDFVDKPLDIKSHDLFNEYKKMSKQHDLNILPFNNNYWSKYSGQPSTYINKHFDEVTFKYEINDFKKKIKKMKFNPSHDAPDAETDEIKPNKKNISEITKSNIFEDKIKPEEKEIFKDELLLPNNYNDLLLNSSEKYSSLEKENAVQFSNNILTNSGGWLTPGNMNKYGYENKIFNSVTDFNNLIPKI